MSPETIIAQLKQINSWRRGEESEPQPDPKHVGDVLDAAAESLASLIASNTTLRRERKEARAEVAKLKGALALGQENCDAEYEELREERDKATARCIERDERIEQMGASWDKTKSDLARVTAEREANRDAFAQVLRLEAELDHHKIVKETTDAAHRELSLEHAALRARVADLQQQLDNLTALVNTNGK